MGKKKGKKSSSTLDEVEEEIEINDEQVEEQSADSEDNTTEDAGKTKTRGQLIQAHKREQKELKVKTSAMLHSFNKNDKKAKQQTVEAIKKLEDELKKKQDAELAAFDLKEKETTPTTTKTTTTTPTTKETPVTSPAAAKPEVGKTQKKKAKKAAKSAALLNRIEKEKTNTVSQRQIELDQLKKRLQPLNLVIHEISADGNCLYNSVLHQLEVVSLSDEPKKSTDTCANLRKKVAEFMRSNSDDFLPFFDAEDGDLSKEFEEYCNKVASTTAWGGQLELKALAHILNQYIVIHTAAGPDIEMGDEYKGKEASPPLHLTYHKHYYTLGEHYNSAIVKPPDEDD